MTDAATIGRRNAQPIFRATYSEWKLVKTRSVIQVIFEVPLDREGEAYDVLGGMPHPGKEIWCAIARLNANGKECEAHEQSSPQLDKSPASEGETPVRARKPVAAEKRLAQQAGICTGDPVFHKFLDENDLTQAEDTLGDGITWDDIAKVTIYDICGVSSRAEIIPGTHAGQAWDALYSKFVAWKLSA